MRCWSTFLAALLAEEPPQLDVRAAYVLGGLLTLAGIWFFVVKGINETRVLMAGKTKPQPVPVSAPVPSPLMIAAQPVFATMEVVTRVDESLRNDFNKLEKYVHESVHEQGKAIQAVSTLIKDGDESHQEAIAEVNKQGEERITKVHDRLNVVVRDIGGIEAKTDMANQQLVGVRQTLEVLLSRSASQPRGGVK